MIPDDLKLVVDPEGFACKGCVYFKDRCTKSDEVDSCVSTSRLGKVRWMIFIKKKGDKDAHVS